MPYDAALNCLSSALEILVLSWTPYARLVTAAGPKDYDAILNRTLRELKFHIESLLAILFFMATTLEGPLISWTLACLLYTLLVHIFVDALSGEILHHWLNDFPCTRHLLACMVKLPAHAVIATLFALALTSWPSIYTLIVCCFVASGLVGMLMVRLRVWHALVRGCRGVGGVVRRPFGRKGRECNEGRCEEGMGTVPTAVSAGDQSPTDDVKIPECARVGVSHVNQLV